jgi:predicted RNA-binding protein with PIN domain
MRTVETSAAESGSGSELGGGAWGEFWSEAGGALAIVALFVALGLGAAGLAGGAYPSGAMGEDTELEREMDAGAAEAPRLWLVDGFNVLHAAVLKGRDRQEWWRGPARARVLDLAGALPDSGVEIVVVFDGDDPDEAAELPPRVQQVFAPSADDWLVRRVKALPRGAPVTVVTADRQLAARARHHGAEIVSPRSFAERCRSSAG